MGQYNDLSLLGIAEEMKIYLEEKKHFNRILF